MVVLDFDAQFACLLEVRRLFTDIAPAAARHLTHPRMPRPTGLCLFGGSFDPPHATHRRLAETVSARLETARFVVLPCGDHPHKGASSMTTAEHRLAMCRLGFADIPNVVVDDREIRREGPSFSIDTIREFRAELEDDDVPIYWLIGSDNLPLLPTWHEHHALLAEATVLTFPRRGHTIEPGSLDGLDLNDAEKEMLLAHRLVATEDEISATDVRAALQRGEERVRHVAAVAEYIEEHRLYR